MKYLAILKDSLREAIDTKVFYVMLAASSLLVLAVGSLSFQPLSVTELGNEHTIQYTIQPLNVNDRSQLAKFAGGFGLPLVPTSAVWIQEKVEPADGSPDSPDSPLHFVIRSTYGSQAAAARVRKSPAETIETIKNRFATLNDWKILEVTRVAVEQDSAPGQVIFDVYTRPTPATRRVWPCQPSFLFGLVPMPLLRNVALGQQLYYIEDTLVNGVGAWAAILVSVVITAFFIPNMLRKGTVELLLVKPIHRSTLLLYKYVGGLTFIFLNTCFVVGGVWLMLGLRSGVWAGGFLLTIFIITLFFAILYSVSALFGVLTGSPIVSILLTCVVWFMFWAAGKLYLLPDTLRIIEDARARQEQHQAKHVPDMAGRETEPPARTSEDWWVKAVNIIHFILPRYSDLDHLTTRLLVRDLLQAKQLNPEMLQNAKFSWSESLSVNAIFVALMLGLSCLRFAIKDY